MHRLEAIKDALVGQVEGQLGKLDCVNAEELGEVVDMIKDLNEACYYHSIVKAMKKVEEEMEKKDDKETNFYYLSYPQQMPYAPYYGHMGGRMGYSDGNYGRYMDESDSTTRGKNIDRWNNERNSNNWNDRAMNRDHEWNGMKTNSDRNIKEGRAGMARRSYMEGKDKLRNKEYQIKELEEYMQELGADVTEMIEDATPEEKTLLHKKLTALANKIELLSKK